MPEIIRVTSEALQATIRRLLPSQQGFGDDLQATNLITPIIDLTPSAEGSETRQDLQSALAFGSESPFQANGATVTVQNTAGFFRVFGCASCIGASGTVRFNLSDGLSTKQIWAMSFPTSGSSAAMAQSFDFIVFLRGGDSLTAVSTSALGLLSGTSRQIADPNGNLTDPVGFTPQ